MKPIGLRCRKTVCFPCQARVYDLSELREAVSAIMLRYPFGFSDPHFYTGRKPVALTEQNKRPNGHSIVPYVGFLDVRLLKPLANPDLHDFIERIVGKGFYLSNTWLQTVGPDTDRLLFHKDERGNITFNILLDDIGPGMGSTCVVPGTHVNTPYPTHCMRNIFERHPAERDVAGAARDLVFFSTEAWHGRSRNTGNRATRRLFYNFFSRSSRDTTTWNGVVDAAQIESAKSVIPECYHHLFRLDPQFTRTLSRVQGPFLRKYAYEKSSSTSFWRDIFYAAYTYGKPASGDVEAGYLKPYTTRLVEMTRFDLWTYLSHLKLIPTAKNCYVFLRSRIFSSLSLVRRNRPLRWIRTLCQS